MNGWLLTDGRQMMDIEWWQNLTWPKKLKMPPLERNIYVSFIILVLVVWKLVWVVLNLVRVVLIKVLGLLSHYDTIIVLLRIFCYGKQWPPLFIKSNNNIYGMLNCCFKRCILKYSVIITVALKSETTIKWWNSLPINSSREKNIFVHSSKSCCVMPVSNADPENIFSNCKPEAPRSL